MPIGSVDKFCGHTRFVVVLHQAIEREGAFCVEDPRIDVTCFVAGVVIVNPREIAGGVAQCAFRNVAGFKIDAPLVETTLILA